MGRLGGGRSPGGAGGDPRLRRRRARRARLGGGCRARIQEYFDNGVTTSSLAILPLDPDVSFWDAARALAPGRAGEALASIDVDGDPMGTLSEVIAALQAEGYTGNWFATATGCCAAARAASTPTRQR